MHVRLPSDLTGLTVGATAGDDRQVGDGATGFDLLPRRPAAATAVLLAVVVTAVALFAHLFRETTLIVLDWLTHVDGPIEAARSLHPGVLFVVVTAAVGAAAAVGAIVDKRWRAHVGVEAVAASARGEGRSISLRASSARALATWLMSLSAVSVGRESAIIESGGAVGATSARRLGGRGDAMATAGIAAAFAAAYHAPLAAVMYVEEHLGVRRSRRAVTFAIAGALGGHLATWLLFRPEPLFPDLQGTSWHMIGLGILVMVPAVLAARLFMQLRVRLNGRAVADRFGVHRAWVIGSLAVLAGGAVAAFPSAAGNGMEALRTGAVDGTVAVAVALSVGKLIGTTAALASGAPGGVLTPSMSITAGVGLLVLHALDQFGIAVVHPWDGMVACMAIGVAVGMRSPLVAVLLVPEMIGRYSLVPAIAVVVGVGYVLDRLLDIALVRIGAYLPGGVYDEDA